MANPKTFGSDYERGYQAALADVEARLHAWIDQGLRVGDLASELALLRKPKTRRETAVLELPKVAPAVSENRIPFIPILRCDGCDNGLDEGWLYCPFCSRENDAP